MDEATLRLEFPQAIKFMREKIPLPSTSWRQYSGEVQQVAFTVAQITQVSLLSDIQELIVKQLETGVTVEGFKRNFSTLIDKSGWNPANKGYRAELVLQQNLKNAHARGRWEQMRSPAIAKSRPYWEFRHRDSRVPRPRHLAQDGKVYPADADVWKAIFPPNFGCKCTAHALSDQDIERLGLKVDTPPPLEDVADKGWGHGFTELPKERDRLVAEAIKRLPPEFADLLTEDATFAELIEAALNGTLDFAAPLFGKGSKADHKRPNCNPVKSHFCQRPGGRGSCVPLSKKCKFKPTGQVKQAADFVAEHIYPQTKNDFIKQKIVEAQARAAVLASSNAASPPTIVKKFPSVPAVAYSLVDIEQFEDAIAAGAHRKLEWDTPSGKAVAKIGLNKTRDLIYKMEHDGTEHPALKVLDALKPLWDKVEKITPLKSEDYIYI